MEANTLHELGEFGLIDRIKAQAPPLGPSTRLGIGDDAAVLVPPFAGAELLISTDVLLEGPHFDLRYVPLRHLGYKAVAVNVSDIAAMNGTPAFITVGLGFSSRFPLEAVEELYQGIYAACEAYGVDLVGGDTSTSRAGLSIAITVGGWVAPAERVTRSGAQAGQVLCVTGDLGAAYLGLQVLEREKQEFLANPEMQPQLDDWAYIVGRQLKPEARMDVIHSLRELGVVPSAMIDVSDGLASELLHICQASGVGAAIYAQTLPCDNLTKLAASDFGISPTTAMLNGGEDYELLFTVSQADFERIRHLPDVTAIGITREAEEGVILMTENEAIPLKAQGWRHF